MTKPPKIGKLYWKIVEAGCTHPHSKTCEKGYDWECDICPVIREKKMIEKIKAQNNEPIRKCKRCLNTFEIDYFHNRGFCKRGLPWRDKICKFCRSKEALNYQKKPEGGQNKRLKRIKDFSSFSRHTKENFLFYMENNPHYFQSIFGCEPTKENILNTFNQVNPN